MIGKYIEMSTAHLTESTMQRLEADEIDDAHPVTDEYGAYLPVSDILKNSNTIPCDLKECVDYATRNDVSLIRFDRDVDLIAGLTVYLW